MKKESWNSGNSLKILQTQITQEELTQASSL